MRPWTTDEEIYDSANTINSTYIQLFNHLMTGYKKDVRPVHDWRNTTIVEISIIVRAILDVDEKNEILRSYIWYRQFWRDEFLTWDPQNFDCIENISIPIERIWVPDVVINEFVDTKMTPNIPYVYVTSEGKVRNYKPIQAVTSCSLNIYNFPFDLQICNLTFVSWLHVKQDIDLKLWNEPVHGKDDKGEWEVCNVTHQYNIFNESNDIFAELQFRITIRRRPLFYVVNLLLPSMFLMMMDIFGFYLPPNCGERVSFKITLLLGYSVFLIIVSDTLPATATQTPLIGVYFAVCMALLVTSLTETILVVRLVHNQHLKSHVPHWMKYLVLEKIAVILCIQDKKRFHMAQTRSSEISLQKENSTSTGGMDGAKSKFSHYSREDSKDYEKTLPQREGALIEDNILQEIMAIHQQLKKQEEHPAIGKEWLEVGYVLDVLFFRMYLVTLLANGIILGLMWSLGQQELRCS
ncbi:5-hydroxytryptamine receptor 3A-like [Microcaecilia unicolor]|uniref:5-hydroxytryptamine receptor 3A n=1 Tax=Microcaecilia unicolor TaxID=1415580 RepID=A0A6P7ZE04_9AMPH|nr:5-hydroxytryptamine receptor 3A-like [Microcaecilia unicolor]